MASQANRFTSHTESLRAMAHDSIQERQIPQIQRIIDDFLSQQNVDHSVWADSASRVALRLHRMAGASSLPELRRICFKSLLRLGLYGWSTAAHLLLAGQMELKEAKSCLEDVEGHAVIGLMERLLQHAPEADPALRAFALETLEQLTSSDYEASARYLKSIGPSLAGPCFPVRAALNRGALGVRLRQAAESSDDALSLQEAASIPFPGPAPETARAMAARLSSTDQTEIPSLLAAIARLGDDSTELARDICALLTHKDKAIQAAALDTIGMLRSKTLPTLYARLFQKAPALRKQLLPRLTYLTMEEFHSFLASVDKPYLRYVFWSLFVLLAKLDSRTMAESLIQCARIGPEAEDSRPPQQLWTHLGSTPTKPIEEPMTAGGAAASPRAETNSQPQTRNSSSGSLFSMDNGGGRSEDLYKPANEAGKVHRDQRFEGKDLSGVSYAGAFLVGCVFTNCRIRGSVFSRTVFKDCRFEQTSFEDCDCTGAQWFRCSLDNSSFTDCHLDETVLQRVEATLTLLERCTMRRAHLASSAFRSARFVLADLSFSLVEETDLSGVEFEDCLFLETSFAKPTEQGCSLPGSVFVNCWSKDFAARHPLLADIEAQNMHARLPKLAAAMEQAGLPPPPGKQWEQMAAKAVERWFSLKTLRRTRALFLQNNTRRQDWGMEKLGRPGTDFYRLLPLLLCSDAFDKAMSMAPETPRLRIPDHVPSYTAVQRLREYFPDAASPIVDDKKSFPVEGLYIIGSLGTVAQGRKSDLDYWVCCPLRSMPPEQAALLSRKLERLTDWAETQFGLEAYFFLMDTQDVRDNNFGFSDKESSGSAQALLLKEEFYRTAVFVAGSPPAWWFSPPGSNFAVYQATLQRLSEQLGKGAAADLGHMAQVPADEFFGASLWQIVKGLKSPFKSILKFGLLEAYTGSHGPSSMLLCDRIKKNLLAGSSELWDIDPYVALFREVADYYQSTWNFDTADLVCLAFALKTERREAESSRSLPLCKEVQDLRELFQNKAYPGFARTSAAFSTEMEFSELLKMGARINRFMVNTYMALRDRQTGQSAAMITPEDMTKLGRKIGTYFSVKEHKVERIPILKIKSDFFTEIHFLVSFPGNVKTWHLQGGRFDSVSGRLKMTDLKKGPDLCAILAWVTANHLYSPDVAVKVDRQSVPVTEEDIRGLLSALHRFFTDKKTFETDISESLNAERVTRAFFILNMDLPSDTRRIKHVCALYSTNWGEMFVQDLAAEGSYLAGNPQGYLKKNLGIEVDEQLEKDRFVPTRASCTRIFYDDPE